MSAEPITEGWLKSVGFKWHQFDRQPDKHWLLWLGSAIPDRMTSFEDMGVELAPRWWKNRNGDDVGAVGSWHCWLRADTAGRYHRFLHIRPVNNQADLIRLIEALSGQSWDTTNHFYGNVYQPKHAASIRRDLERADHRIRQENAKWLDVEKDDTRGRALPEHMQAHADKPAGDPP
jgi:hypothetical protein